MEKQFVIKGTNQHTGRTGYMLRGHNQYTRGPAQWADDLNVAVNLYGSDAVLWTHPTAAFRYANREGANFHWDWEVVEVKLVPTWTEYTG